MAVALRTTVVFIILLGLARVDGYPLMSTECRSQSDCVPGECCVLGMMRYSSAQCLPLGQTGDYCREDSTPENRTLYYPNGQSIELVDVHILLCPCDDHLSCKEGICSLDDSYENNNLY